tara:strand:+ start:3902 stop:4405 length:504 start_codon:yes stop_codon:yes gene_type:complete
VTRVRGFRGWYYFRIGYATYFAFILAAINTLTVTYFLAVDNYPSLKLIFPSFEQYIIIIIASGIPLLILVGYAHFKSGRRGAFKSEVDILAENNPYQRRNTVNGELNLRLNLKLISMLMKISKKETLSEKDLQDVEKLYDEILTFSNERDFINDLDLDFLKKQIQKY